MTMIDSEYVLPIFFNSALSTFFLVIMIELYRKSIFFQTIHQQSPFWGGTNYHSCIQTSPTNSLPSDRHRYEIGGMYLKFQI